MLKLQRLKYKILRLQWLSSKISIYKILNWKQARKNWSHLLRNYSVKERDYQFFQGLQLLTLSVKIRKWRIPPKNKLKTRHNTNLGSRDLNKYKKRISVMHFSLVLRLSSLKLKAKSERCKWENINIQSENSNFM